MLMNQMPRLGRAVQRPAMSGVRSMMHAPQRATARTSAATLALVGCASVAAVAYASAAVELESKTTPAQARADIYDRMKQKSEKRVIKRVVKVEEDAEDGEEEAEVEEEEVGELPPLVEESA